MPPPAPSNTGVLHKWRLPWLPCCSRVLKRQPFGEVDNSNVLDISHWDYGLSFSSDGRGNTAVFGGGGGGAPQVRM